ncbi:DUF6096 family protein [Enterococcus olivae]
MTENKMIKMPTFKEVKFGNLLLKLQLKAKDIYRIENRLDESLMSLFMNSKGGMGLPSTKKMLIVLQGANQTPNVSDDTIFTAFEKFLDEGNSTMDLMNIIQELLDESGFFGTREAPKETEKEKEVNFDEEATDFEV